MENPLVKEKLAHMEALLAKSIRAEFPWLTSQLGPAASDDENSSCQDYKDLHVYLNEIYKTQTEVHPSYSGHHRAAGKRFVLTPPHPISNTKKRKTAAPAPNGPSLGVGLLDTSVLVAIATAVAQAQAVVNSTNLWAKAPAEPRTNSPTSSKPNPGAIGTMSGYLDFAGVVESKDHILRMLSSNDINQFSLFKPGHFSNEELFAIGLKIGTIAKLQAIVNNLSIIHSAIGRPRATEDVISLRPAGAPRASERTAAVEGVVSAWEQSRSTTSVLVSREGSSRQNVHQSTAAGRQLGGTNERCILETLNFTTGTSPEAVDASGQPLDDHNNTSTIIKAATAVSLILLGLALLFTVLKVTNWVRKKSEYSRLKAVEARVSQLEYRDLSSHSQPTLRNSGQSHHHLANPLSDLLSIHAPRNQNGGRKKLRNLFDIQEYEGTPA
ncbi:hypothetical protein PCANC_00446 [Puccinia coronata f. sp. avenae]|uniref:Uncharacterized protein n=1 Tax=Puccinia coronata f. sp. avenae TaxID=200324 RepID=A0A2N5W7Z0_9BASI|nr:hypothetical protein PCANC_00446 [Puccinia coronata f. sp. avenae]